MGFLLDMAREGNGRAYRICKRSFDIAFSAAVIVAGFIPGAVLSCFIMRDTGGAPIYTQERVGKGGRLFHILKFRTMVADADNVEKYLDAGQLAQWRSERKVVDDPRVTKLGRSLRITSIDEFPQFINVLKGEMSVVGPRAITREELCHFDNAGRETLLSMRPGITGLWQTGPRNEYTFESGKRQALELEYVASAGLGFDARLFFRTFGSMVDRTGL